VALDPDAAFAAASYGAFQILGQNFKACGFASSFEFVLAQCQTEGAQLLAFVSFLKANGLDDELRSNNWAGFARGYNGSAYAANQYDVKLARAFAKEQAAQPTAEKTAPPAQSGEVNAPLLNVRTNPDPNAQVLTVAAQGMKVNILQRVGDWLRVQLGGTTGFVLGQYVKELPA
jgi:hypothetical protein